MDLVGWARSVWNCSEQIDKVIGATILEEFTDSKVMEQVYDVFFITLRCTEPRRRPTMRDVVKQLEDANHAARTKKRLGGYWPELLIFFSVYLLHSTICFIYLAHVQCIHLLSQKDRHFCISRLKSFPSATEKTPCTY